MSSLLHRGMTTHANRLMAAGAVAVRVFRGEAELGITRAVPGRRGSTEVGAAAASVTPNSKQIDWIVVAAEYLVDGQPDEPRRDDRFVWTDLSGLEHEFTVLPERGERCVEPHDQLGVLLRVHSKRKGVRK